MEGLPWIVELLIMEHNHLRLVNEYQNDKIDTLMAHILYAAF